MNLVGADGSYRDNYNLNATLSLLPLIRTIEPTSVAPGDEVTIKGVCFGNTKSNKGSVLLNGKPIEIVSWSDRQIVAKIPSGIVSGEAELKVTTGERYRYTSNSVKLTILSDVVEQSFNGQGEYNVDYPLDTDIYYQGVVIAQIKFGAKVKYTLSGKMIAPKITEIKQDWTSEALGTTVRISVKDPQSQIKINGELKGFIEPESAFKDDGFPTNDPRYGYAQYSVTKYELYQRNGIYGPGITYKLTPISGSVGVETKTYKIEITFDPQAGFASGTKSSIEFNHNFSYNKKVQHPGYPLDEKSGDCLLRVFRFEFIKAY